jgi:protein SCO1/2
MKLGVATFAFSILVAGSAAARPMVDRDGLPPPNELPAELENIGVDEHLGQKLPLDVELTDQDGKRVRLDDYFHHGRPVIINLAYYNCPMLCGLVMRGLTESVARAEFLPGREFDVVTVSIDPGETTELAKAKRETVLEKVNKAGAGNGWMFHTAGADAVKRLSEAVGFRFRRDPSTGQYAHPAAIAFVSPDGVLTRYLYGIEYPASDLKLAILESGRGQVGSTTDKLLLFCFHYDPQAKGYVLFARNVMKAGGVVTALALGGLLTVLWRREKKRETA